MRRSWVAAAVLIGAVVVIGLVRRSGGVGLDDAVMERIGSVQTAGAATVTPTMLAATWAGDWTPRLALAIGTAAYLVGAGERRRALWLALLIGGAAGLNTSLKHAFSLARPTLVPHLDSVTTFAFPSGHAANTTALVGALALLAGGRWAWGPAVAVAGLVGISRTWLGVHWPTDVLGGWMVGAAAVLTAAPLLPERRAGSKV